MKQRLTLAALIALIGLVFSANLQAAPLVLGNAVLGGDQEVPPNASPAVGVAALAVDPDADTYNFTLFVSGIAPGDLFGVGDNDTAVHIHSAPAGQNGSIVVDVANDGTITPVGTGFSLVSSGSFGGAQNLSDLLISKLYVNVHTNSYNGGEIRGQLTPIIVPEPASLALAGCGLLGLAGLIRRRNRS